MRKEKSKKERNNKGITLIALVITIIVLLILAGVAIATLTGDNGILTKASSSKIKNEQTTVKEQIILAYGEYQIEINTANNTRLASMNETLKIAYDTIEPEPATPKATKKTFIEYLEKDRQVIDGAGIVDVQKLVGNRMTLGNGTGKSDVYIISLDEEGSSYVLNYYDEKENETFLWEIEAENGVKINISKTPDTEKTGTVFLRVTSVEGLITTISNEEEAQGLYQKVENMSEQDKKELYKQLVIRFTNKQEGTNFTTFEEVLQFMNTQDGTILTEEKWWTEIENELNEQGKNLSTSIMEGIGYLFYDETIGGLKPVEIINPVGGISNTYIAKENGTYTFTVKDLITGKTYKKSVEVTNIDKSLPQYYVENIEPYISETAVISTKKLATLREIKIAGSQSWWTVGLRDVETNKFTSFEQAYIIYGGQKLDITDMIEEIEGVAQVDMIINSYRVCEFLRETITDLPLNFEKREYQFILVKDGVEYSGMGKIGVIY